MPQDMIRQMQGERLNIGSVLTWGPDYYYQKQFFSGQRSIRFPSRTASCTTIWKFPAFPQATRATSFC